MLLWLTEYLSGHVSGFGVFGYLTFRTMVSALTALAMSLVIGPIMIRKLSHYQIGQPVRTDGPETHLAKSGTPTMGGAMILVTIAVTTLLWGELGNRYVWMALAVTLAFGVIGWYDDYLKVSARDSRGLAARWKFLWQSLAGLVAAVVLWRLIAGGIDAHMADDATMFLRIPLVVGYVGAILPCMLWVVVALYVNVVQWRRAVGAV